MSDSKKQIGCPAEGSRIVIAQENLKLATFLIHHRWRYTLDWEVMGVNEDTVHLLAGQKKHEGE